MVSKQIKSDNLKRIAIFGGSGALGEEVVRKLAKEAVVTIGYRTNQSKAEMLLKDIKDSGGNASIQQVDMCDEESVHAFFKAASGQWGGLDSIVSVTGTPFKMAKITDYDSNLFRSIIETDVIGSFNILKQGIPYIDKEKGGSIVLFLTSAINRTIEFDGMSSIPKMAVEGLVRMAAREFGPDGIRINAVAPGVIESYSIHKKPDGTELSRNLVKSYLEQTPLGRRGQTSEIADVVNFLVSDSSSYVNGQIINVDGGYSA